MLHEKELSVDLVHERRQDGQKLWGLTIRMRWWIRVAEMSFLCRMAGQSLRDRVRSSEIWRTLKVKLLLLYIERTHLRWFGIPLGLRSDVSCWKGFRAHPTKRCWGRPRTRLREFIARLTWKPPWGLHRSAGVQSWGEEDIWVTLLHLLPPGLDSEEVEENR